MAARRQPQRKEPDVKNATPTVKARQASSQAELSKDEVREMDRELEQRKGEFMAAQEARHAETLKRIMGEENARNGRAPAAA